MFHSLPDNNREYRLRIFVRSFRSSTNGSHLFRRPHLFILCDGFCNDVTTQYDVTMQFYCIGLNRYRVFRYVDLTQMAYQIFGQIEPTFFSLLTKHSVWRIHIFLLFPAAICLSTAKKTFLNCGFEGISDFGERERPS